LEAKSCGRLQPSGSPANASQSELVTLGDVALATPACAVSLVNGA
jgi:hypothetical protein